MNTKIVPKLYGTSWCWLTNGFDNYLRMMGIKFERYDVEQDIDAETTVRGLNGGELKFPIILINNAMLKNPTIQELNRILHQHELL